MPIDPDFQKKLKKVGKERGIAIWGPVDPLKKLGIRGTYVAVDWDICTGCGICLEICPKQLYEWVETSSHTTSEKKAFPVRESDCVECIKCETQCPVQAIRVTMNPHPSDLAVMLLALSQIIVGVIYGVIFGPYFGLEIPFYIGWAVLPTGCLITFWLSKELGKKGEIDEIHKFPTVLVDSGIYSIVRHPIVLGATLMMSASILISQHWLTTIVGVSMIGWIHVTLPKTEEGLILKFGEPYKRYMQKVPRMNFVVGIIRLLRRKREVKVDR